MCFGISSLFTTFWLLNSIISLGVMWYQSLPWHYLNGKKHYIFLDYSYLNLRLCFAFCLRRPSLGPSSIIVILLWDPSISSSHWDPHHILVHCLRPLSAATLHLKNLEGSNDIYRIHPSYSQHIEHIQYMNSCQWRLVLCWPYHSQAHNSIGYSGSRFYRSSNLFFMLFWGNISMSLFLYLFLVISFQ